MVILMVIAISVLWFVGHQAKKDEEQKRQTYLKEILAKQNNLESIVKETTTADDNLNDLELAEDISKIKINLSLATSTGAIRQYGLDLKRALDDFSQKRDSEIKAVTEALDANDSSKIKTIVASRLIYEKASQELKKMLVPADLANLHRQLINNFDNSIIFLRQMEKILDQPQAGLEASRLFLKESVYFYQLINKINNYFNTRQIEYSEEEKMQLFLNFD